MHIFINEWMNELFTDESLFKLMLEFINERTNYIMNEAISVWLLY